MAIDQKHPDLLDVEQDYLLVRDCYGGQRRVKEKSTLYLPPTSGMIEDGIFAGNSFNIRSKGYAAYQAYLTRAVFPELVKDAVETLVGVMHREPPTIVVPGALEPMLKVATRKGETLEQLLREVNTQQILAGRYGLLADIAPNRTVPHLATYDAESILNWDDERQFEFGVNRLVFLVLDESKNIRGKGGDLYSWSEVPTFRACILETLNPDAPEGERNPLVYKTFVEVDGVAGPTVVPRFSGNASPEIPWVFIGAKDLYAAPGMVPVLGLANLSMTIYRGEADYRQCLFMQGQDTLVVIGAESGPGSQEPEKVGDTRVGAGSKIEVPIGGDAKYIGVEGKGLPEVRLSLQNDYARGREAGARLLEPRGSQAESGEALRIRVSASTASLRQVALTGAAGLESVLRACATWVGANPDDVRVIPNLDFAETREDPSGVGQLMDAKIKGAPISRRSVHRWLQENDFTRLSFDEEEAEIALEPKPEPEETTTPDEDDPDGDPQDE